MLSAASIANTTTGRISGYNAGIYISGTGTVSNQGTIQSTDTTGNGYTYTTVDNTATIVSAAVILGQGSIDNAAGGLISGALGGVGTDRSGTVSNAGTIVGGQFGVFIESGGSVGNAAGGTIGGSRYGVYGGVGGTLTIVNQGSINASNGRAVESIGGGSVTNAAGGTITGSQYGIRADFASATIVNAGSIAGTSRVGAVLRAGGQFSNASSGTITGAIAAFGAIGTAAATATNAGLLAGYTFGIAIYSANAQITNSGSVSSQKLGGGTVFGGAGIGAIAGGTVVNAAGGHVAARWIGVQIGARTTSVGGTLINQGSIFASDGTNGAAVWIHGSAFISNASSGTIVGGPFGVVAYYGTTIVNAGSIGGDAYAIDIVNAGFNNRVVALPGASFSGKVEGRNTIGATAVSTLELGSGASTGTLSGLGIQFVHFAQTTIDAGASWTLTGTNTVVSGATLTDSGTLINVGTIGGGVLLNGGSVTNAAGATITGTFAAIYGPSGSSGGTISNAGLLAGPASGFGAGIALFAGGVITNSASGTIAGSEGIYATASSTAANMAALANYGSILASQHQGVEFVDGGSVVNGSGGTIAGAYNGVSIQFQNAASQSATVVNRGLIVGTASYGVQLKSAGTDVLTNAAGGIVQGGQGGAYIAAGGTVFNAGTIGAIGTGANAVVFRAGAADRLVVTPGAVFSGFVDGGNTVGSSIVSTLELASAASAGTFAGLGTQFFDFGRVTVDAGASWTLTGSNTVLYGGALTDSGTLTNTGTIGGGVLLAGGTVVNRAGAAISGSLAAVYAGTGSGAGTVVNAGVLLGGNNPTRSAGIALLAGGFVSNASGGSIAAGGAGIYIVGSGTIQNAGIVGGTGTHATGIEISGTAQVTNAATGTVSASNNGINAMGAGFVLNQGLIQVGSIGNSAVYLGQGGSVVNTGILQGGTFGIIFGTAASGGGTVTNAGTIVGSLDAVGFTPGRTNRLILAPGFSQSGAAEGGNTIGATAVSTLELASAATTGRMTGLGTQFRDFGQTTIDGGASWSFTGANTVASGGLLTNSGTLFANGVLIDNGSIFSNNGTIVVGSTAGTNGALTVNSGGTLNIGVAGTIPALLIGNGVASGTLAAASGTVVVTGTNAVLNSYAPILVGRSSGATGLLKIANGATAQAVTSVETLQAAIGIGLNGPGTLIVTDPGSVFTAKGQAVVGRAGTGNLLVSNQGTLVLAADGSGNNPTLQVGLGSSNNAGQIGGSGSGLVNSGGWIDGGTTTSVVQIGGNGDNGTLTFNGGSMQAGFVKLGTTNTLAGTVYTGAGILSLGTGGLVSAFGTTSASIVLGQGQGGSGTVAITGGTLLSAGQFLIGSQSAASGIVTIGPSGTLSTHGLSDANAAGSSGTIVVNGGTLSDAGNMNIGLNGAGFLTISAGGTVVVNQGSGPAVNIGVLGPGSGSVLVTGSLSALTVTGQFIVGDQGTGSLDVANGGLVDASTSLFDIGNQGGGTGVASVEGGGTLLTGNLNIANIATGVTQGRLTIGASGIVSTSTVTIGSGGTAIVVGASGAAAVLTSSGGIVIGQSGTGAGLSVGQFGTIADNGGLTIGQGTGNSGTVVVNGGSIGGGGISIGNGGTGFLTISAGGIANAGTATIAIGSQSGGSGTVGISGGNARLSGGVLNVAMVGTAIATGLLNIGSGGTVSVGSVNIGNGGTIALSGGLLDPPASISVNAGGTIVGFGTLDGDLINGGLVIASGGLLDIVGSIAGSGGLSIAAGATLELDGSVAVTETVAFTPTSTSVPGGVLQLGTVGFAGTIASFFQGDSLILTGITDIATVSVAGSLLDVHRSGGSDIFLHLDTGFNYTGATFNFFASGGNSVIGDNVPCFLAGTLIRTERGEIPVQQLAIGDRVVTLNGSLRPIVWIGKRAYSSAFAAGNRDIVPILIRRGALADNVPTRDLHVSPLHAMYLDNVLIQAELLVNGVSVVRRPEIDPIRYFHIELETHDIVFADGAPAETFIERDNRGMFHNGTEFAALYPDAASRELPFCAPRIASGPILDRVRRAIDGRAGLTDNAAGPLQGNLDGMDGTTLTGWAFDPAQPDSAVALELLDGDGTIARTFANRYRSDLETVGIGDGRHGFELQLNRALSPDIQHALRVRRVGDGMELPGSPFTIEPSNRRTLVRAVRQAVDVAAEAAGDTATLAALLDTFQANIDRIRRLRATQRSDTDGDARLLRWAQGPRLEQKRVLIVADTLPRQKQAPDARLLLNQIAALRGLGWAVEFVASTELARGDAAAAALKAWGVTCHRAPFVASVEEVLRRKRNAFDMVYLFGLTNTHGYAPLARAWQAKARIVCGLPAVRGTDSRGIATLRMVDSIVVRSRTEAIALQRSAPGATVYAAIEAAAGSGAMNAAAPIVRAG